MFEADLQDDTLKQLQTLSRCPSTESANRLFSAERYLARLTPHLASFGITRLADVTGLDRLGIPVVQAIRPQALSNAVNQGKGLTIAEAAVSSVMEALETYFSEASLEKTAAISTPLDVYGSSASHVLSNYLPEGVPDDWTKEPIRFTGGIDLQSGLVRHVPTALVSTEYSPASPHAQTPFERTTTGLGGGATQEEALIHGLCETIERIGTGRAMQMHGFFERFRFSPDGILDAPTFTLLKTLEEARLLHALYQCPSVGGFPVVWVRLLDEIQSPTSLPFHADGFACRGNLKDAVQAALLEAVQTRAAVIAGGREDITWRFYPKRWDDQLLAFERAQMHKPVSRKPDLHAPANETVASLTRALVSENLIPIAVPVAANTDIPLHIVRIVTLAAAEDPSE